VEDRCDDSLAARIRSALGDRAVREVRMFGGVSFMVDDHIVVAARAGGDLLVRIDPRRRDEFLKLPGVSAAVMPTGRAMGAQWISVDADHLVAAAQVADWVHVALDDRAAEPPSGG